MASCDCKDHGNQGPDNQGLAVISLPYEVVNDHLKYSKELVRILALYISKKRNILPAWL